MPADPDQEQLSGRVIDLTIRLLVLGVLAAWCFALLRPFLAIIVWGAILAIALYPVFNWLRPRVRDSDVAAATILTLVGLLVILGPVTLLATGLAGNVETLLASGLEIPPPPSSVAEWPVVGARLTELWTEASSNLEAFLERFEPQLQAVLTAVLGVAAGAGLTLLEFMASMVIAGAALVQRDALGKSLERFVKRLSPTRGVGFTRLAAATVRNVARGVIGVAVLQGLLLGLGFLAAGIPLAGLWTLLCIFLTIIQIGPTLVVVGTLIYAWLLLNTGTAVLFTLWIVPISLLDNFLRPIVMSMGLPVPMLVIIIGVIGGTLLHGLIGLFIGPVILALGYELLRAWTAEGAPPSAKV